MNITSTLHQSGKVVSGQTAVYPALNAFNTAIDPYRSREQAVQYAVHKAATADEQRLAHWKSMGRFYGYPECCVSAFLKNCCAATKQYYPNAPWDGTGFVPCMCCAKEAAKDFPAWVAATIEPHRLSAVPFFPPTL